MLANVFYVLSSVQRISRLRVDSEEPCFRGQSRSFNIIPSVLRQCVQPDLRIRNLQSLPAEVYFSVLQDSLECSVLSTLY